MNRRHARWGALAVAIAITGCSSSTSDGSSAGTTTSAIASTEAPGTPTASSSPSTLAADETDPTSSVTDTTVTSAEPTTTARTTTTTAPPLGDAADCPLGALAASDDRVTIDFWYAWAGVRGDVTKALVDEFNASQDKVAVNATFQGGPLGTEVVDTFVRSIDSGDGPDVASDLGANTQTWLDTGSILPVGACVSAAHADVSDLLPAAQAIGMDGDTLAAMPWASGGQVLYYNRTAFMAAGLDPDTPPTTLDEVRTASTAIMAAGAAHHGISMFASTNIIRGFFGRSGEPWATSADGSGRADHSNGGDAFGVRLLTELSEMAQDGELTAFAPTDPSPDDLLAIASGDSAMAIAPAGSLGDVIAALKSGVGPDVDLGVAPAPSFGAKVSIDLEGSGAPIWIAKGDDPAKVEAAYEFATWMMDPAQIAEWVTETGSIAIRTTATMQPSLVQFWSDNPLFRVATEQASDPTKPLVVGEARVGAGAVSAAFDNAANAIMTNGADPTATLAAATATADAAIADYNARSTPGG